MVSTGSLFLCPPADLKSSTYFSITLKATSRRSLCPSSSALSSVCPTKHPMDPAHDKPRMRPQALAHPPRTSQGPEQCPGVGGAAAGASAVGSAIVARGPGEDVQAGACLRGGSRTEPLPRACCRLLLSLCLPEGGRGQQADNGPHSLASRPWPLELSRQLLAQAAASAGLSRSPRPACWAALITWCVPGAHRLTLCSGEGTGGL